MRCHSKASAASRVCRLARLLKITARIIETASRVRIAFAAACPRPRASEQPDPNNLQRLTPQTENRARTRDG